MKRNRLTQEELKQAYAEAILANPNYYINENGYLDYRGVHTVDPTAPSLLDKKRKSIDYQAQLVRRFRASTKERETLLARIRAVDFLAEYFPEARIDAALASLQDMLIGQLKRGISQGKRVVLSKSKRKRKPARRVNSEERCGW